MNRYHVVIMTIFLALTLCLPLSGAVVNRVMADIGKGQCAGSEDKDQYSLVLLDNGQLFKMDEAVVEEGDEVDVTRNKEDPVDLYKIVKDEESYDVHYAGSVAVDSLVGDVVRQDPYLEKDERYDGYITLQNKDLYYIVGFCTSPEWKKDDSVQLYVWKRDADHMTAFLCNQERGECLEVQNDDWDGASLDLYDFDF